MIYLDNMATTPMDHRVWAVIKQQLEGNAWANPSSTHQMGRVAMQAIQEAREQVGSAVNMAEDAVVFTSGATESINLALRGAAQSYHRQGKHIITVATEHKAVLETVKSLEKEGFDVTILPVEADGLLNLTLLQAAMRPETILISVMAVNNETGIMQPLAKIADIAHAGGALFHVDGAQALGKMPIDMPAMGIDLLSLSAHKCYGPKGVGALVMRQKPKIRLAPLLHGGFQQAARSGTLPTHLIAGMGKACSLVKSEYLLDNTHAQQLLAMVQQFLVKWPGVVTFGDAKSQVPYVMNLAWKGVRADALLAWLDDSVMLSAGSACSAAVQQASPVLQAMGVAPAIARDAVRISWGRMTTISDMQLGLEKIGQAVDCLRKASQTLIASEDIQ